MSLSLTGRIILLVLAILLVPHSPVWGENHDPPCPSKKVEAPFLSIVALYHQDLEGLYFTGICHALRKHNLVTSVKLEKISYGNEEAGFSTLKNILEGDKANILSGPTDIVLGPTDSGVFLRGISELDDHSKIPVISPLVTAPVEFDPDSTFFTVNVTLTRRSKHLAYSLSKYGLRSVMVLHSDSPFGQQTEAAFREAYLGGNPNVKYRPLQYETGDFGEKAPDLQVSQVLVDRPEGLGIFGTREEVSAISNLLATMNSTLISYRPILFTPIDFRRLDTGNNEIVFVSLSSSEKSDDVEVLTYNTVLLILEQLKAKTKFSEQRTAFLASLVDRFHGASNSTTKNHSKMKFRDGRNLSEIHVIKRSPTNELSKIKTPDLFEFFSLKFTLLYKTRGWWVLASLFLVMVIPICLSILDLKGWYRGTLRELFFNKFSLSFIAFNWGIVVALYSYLAETGRIFYDSPLTALIVAIGPMTFLKSTIFNTSAGKAIGLSSLYDNSMKWLNDKLRGRKFQLKQKFISILAYYNSLESMKYELQQFFSHSRTKKEKEKLEAQLLAELEQAETHLDKRVVCAKRLFEEFKWGELINKEFVPPGFGNKDPIDPDEMIKASARYIAGHQDSETIWNTLNNEIDRVLENYKDANLGINEEKRARPYHAICLLVKYGNYGLIYLKRDNLLPKDWGKDSSRRGWWKWLRSKLWKEPPTSQTVSSEEIKKPKSQEF